MGLARCVVVSRSSAALEAVSTGDLPSGRAVGRLHAPHERGDYLGDLHLRLG